MVSGTIGVGLGDCCTEQIGISGTLLVVEGCDGTTGCDSTTIAGTLVT